MLWHIGAFISVVLLDDNKHGVRYSALLSETKLQHVRYDVIYFTP